MVDTRQNRVPLDGTLLDSWLWLGYWFKIGAG